MLFGSRMLLLFLFLSASFGSDLPFPDLWYPLSTGAGAGAGNKFYPISIAGTGKK